MCAYTYMLYIYLGVKQLTLSLCMYAYICKSLYVSYMFLMIFPMNMWLLGISCHFLSVCFCRCTLDESRALKMQTPYALFRKTPLIDTSKSKSQ